MTYDHTQPVRSANSSPGPATNAKTIGSAALMTFGTGMAALVGYGLIDVIGAIVGIAAAIYGIVQWGQAHGKVFPDTGIPGKSVAILAVVDVVLFGILLLMA